MRRRRTDASVELRKAKKEEKLTKRRNLTNLDDEPTSPLSESTNKVTASSLNKMFLRPKLSNQSPKSSNNLVPRLMLGVNQQVC